MKLLVHNFLSSKFLKGVTTGYPLKLIATKVSRQESDFEANFLRRMVPRLDWSALLMATRSVAADVALPESLPDQWETDEPLLRSIHQALMEVEVEEACKNELKSGAAMESLPADGSSKQEGTEERLTRTTNEPQFSQRELSYSDLLRLLSCLEGELQARDVLIALLKAERAKNLLAQARYGRLTWREPLTALRRDAILEGTDDDEADHDLTTTYESQLNQLEKLINSQRKANQRSKELLAMVEKKHLKTLRELEVERRRRKHDAAQGDDVYMMLEKEREKLQKEILSVREELEQAKEAAEKSHTLLEREKNRHKEIVLYLLQERRQLLVRFAEERAKNLKAKATDEDAPKTSSTAAQIELLKKQLDECTLNLEQERAVRAKLEQTVKTQEEDLTLIRQTILNKVKQSSLRQKAQAAESPSANTVKMSPKLANPFPSDQKKVMQLNDRKQPSPLAKSAPGIGTSAASDDFSRYHILSRPKMLCDSQETVAASTTRVVGSSTTAGASPKPLRHQPAAVACPYTSSFSFAYNASSVFVPQKGSLPVGDHYTVVYGAGGQMLPSQIPQHNSRRVPQLPSTDYTNTGVRQPVPIRQANETASYHSPPSYNLALQYSTAVKDQWTTGGVDLTNATTNPSSNIPLHTSVGRRPAAAPTSHVRRPASGSGPQQVCSSAKPVVELTIDEQEGGIVEPEIAQLEAVINSLIMVSSVNADLAPQCAPPPLISCPTCDDDDDDEEMSESPSSNGSSGVTSESSNMPSQSEMKEYSSASVHRPLSSRAKAKEQSVPEKTVRSVSRCNVEKCTKGSAVMGAKKNRRREDRLLVDQQTRKSAARKVSVRATQV
ncbi:hypothetical protein M513_09109 [Trichuris suis]|uniref:Cortactin-binding protein-2 N-terminal domain-containing protein n=1 Tax=Trichuris suis TaxID=68888 RepID=A0A085LYH0_9BILA|nr:hypothetical protein M513_09109 [Trichuris suis]